MHRIVQIMHVIRVLVHLRYFIPVFYVCFMKDVELMSYLL